MFFEIYQILRFFINKVRKLIKMGDYRFHIFELKS